MADIEYFYAAYSGYAYLGSAYFMAIAKAAEARIVHRPMDLRRVMAGIGAVPIGQRGQAHIDYFFRREIDRWAEHRGIEVMAQTPTHHANEIGPSNCLVIAAVARDLDADGLAHALLEAHWRDDADLADRAALARIAAGLGMDGETLLADSQSPAVMAQYEANTQEAIRRSVFGSPTYFVGGDMFYGQDHLDLVERALTKPYTQ